jgi:hypothetical protein
LIEDYSKLEIENQAPNKIFSQVVGGINYKITYRIKDKYNLVFIVFKDFDKKFTLRSYFSDNS